MVTAGVADALGTGAAVGVAFGDVIVVGFGEAVVVPSVGAGVGVRLLGSCVP